MSNTKVTVRSQFEETRDFLKANGREDLAEFIEGRLALVNKRSTAVRKPTAKQVENEGFKADILAWMQDGVIYSAGDVLKGVPSIVDGGLSINRVSALMTQLVDAGAVTKTVEKRKCFYSLAE